MFSGDYYVLNALWFGVGLVMLGYLIKPLRHVLYWCMPVGIVLLYNLYCGFRQYNAVRKNENVTSIKKPDK